jgi:hypothetical protein
MKFYQDSSNIYYVVFKKITFKLNIYIAKGQNSPPPASILAWGPKNKFFQKLRTQTSNKQNQAWEGYLCESGRYFISKFLCQFRSVVKIEAFRAIVDWNNLKQYKGETQ